MREAGRRELAGVGAAAAASGTSQFVLAAPRLGANGCVSFARTGTLGCKIRRS